MKDMFPSDESYSKIDEIDIKDIIKIKTEAEMKKKSKVKRILTLSVSGFVFGISLTGLILYSSTKEPKKTGVGGLETSVVTEYSEVKSLVDNGVVDFSNESVENLESEALYSENSLSYNDLNNFSDEKDDELTLTYQTYRVKPGDMIGVIADKYDVTQDTIISVNNIKQSRLIQPGQYLKIPSMPGIIYTTRKDGETIASIADSYEVNPEKCALVNYLDTATELSAGVAVFVPDAELDWATKQEINGDLFKKPLHCRYWLSSPYGWRDSPFHPGKRSFHSGIDMAANLGNYVYPAMDGKVIETGYNNVYGNYVIIAHHSGYKTLYGHLSKINCKRGNFVYTNTVIGRVGSTGMSTGPHLHFTVYKNGKTVNPSLLIN